MEEKLNDLLEKCIEFTKIYKLSIKNTITPQQKANYYSIEKIIQILQRRKTTDYNLNQEIDSPIGHGILKEDYIATYYINGKKNKLRLKVNSEIYIYKELPNSYLVRIFDENKNIIEFEIPLYLVTLSKGNLSDIQNLPNTDIVVFPQSLPNNLICLDTFLKGLSISQKLDIKINFNNISPHLHQGLRYICYLLYNQEELSLNVEDSHGKPIKDKPLDQNSSISGSIDFSLFKDWLKIYSWSEEEIELYGNKEVAFRFTCYVENSKTFFLVEELGSVSRNKLTDNQISELKNKYIKTNFISKDFKNYTPLSKEQSAIILSAFENVPKDYQEYFDNLIIVFDKDPKSNGVPENAMAYVNNKESEGIILAFTNNAFEKNATQIVAGDKGNDDKNSQLEYLLCHELGHIIEKKILKQTITKVNNCINIINATKNELKTFYENNEIANYINPNLRSKAMSPSRMKDICNSHILPNSNQIPDNLTTIDEITNFISENYDKYFTKGVLKQTIESKINALMDKGQSIPLFLKTEGIILPSGTHHKLIDSSWLVQKESKNTAFTQVLEKDGSAITEYSKNTVGEAFAESFALFLTQPETTKTISPNIYNYFKTKIYEKHITCKLCEDC